MAKIKLVVSATIEETFCDFIISKNTKGFAEKVIHSVTADASQEASANFVYWPLAVR